MKVILFAPLVPWTALLLSACSGKDANAPSTALFEQVIKADKTATQPVCRNITTGVDRLPAKYEADSDQEEFFQDYKVLQDHGYVAIRKVKTVDPFGGAQVDALEVSLTPKWNTDFGTPVNGERCIGEWKAQSVKDFTPPGDVNGVKVSQVTVTGTQEYTGWAKDPTMRQVFGLSDLRPNTERTYTLVLKDTGWQVAGVNQ